MALKRLTHERYDRMRQDGTFPSSPEPPAPAAPRQISDDLPTIREAHPNWWQVRRIEQDATGQRREVLIYEVPSENAAMAVCLLQRYHCRVVKWGDKRQPFQNFNKPAKIIATPEQTMAGDGEGRR